MKGLCDDAREENEFKTHVNACCRKNRVGAIKSLSELLASEEVRSAGPMGFLIAKKAAAPVSGGNGGGASAADSAAILNMLNRIWAALMKMASAAGVNLS